MDETVKAIFRSVILTPVRGEEMNNRIFGLDPQLLADSVLLALSVFVLFLVLSYLLFNPARALLEKRKQNIKEVMEQSAQEKFDALALKKEYEDKLSQADKTVDGILYEAKARALKKEDDILLEAGAEAARILERARKEIELEKTKLQDEVKKEMVTVAAYIAGKMIEASFDNNAQNKLIEDALEELGDKTWLN